MDNMFKDVIPLTDIQMITSSPEEKVEITSMKNTFENCKSLTSINLIGFHTDNVESMHKLFSGSGISSIDLSIFNTSNVQLLFIEKS